jgi:bifunctional DNA-binding transcriptional regulator/antitoxin component of YhaV-PrlF toxin-antitoxin module
MVKCKVWKVGSGSLVVTIPKSEREFHELKEQDLIDITINQVVKRAISKSGIETK